MQNNLQQVSLMKVNLIAKDPSNYKAQEVEKKWTSSRWHFTKWLKSYNDLFYYKRWRWSDFKKTNKKIFGKKIEENTMKMKRMKKTNKL